ncbi:hypothetical protein [Ottowia sp. oral taxon 894]|uniref:hypothetical protein n=1 Tax=Ottowia sp. oral taxon 894 TaxID=1658672 RepID=UPI0012E1D1F9|nr:hypothetical protein [Ottowia sp. oral taxon 894]
MKYGTGNAAAHWRNESAESSAMSFVRFHLARPSGNIRSCAWPDSFRMAVMNMLFPESAPCSAGRFRARAMLAPVMDFKKDSCPR